MAPNYFNPRLKEKGKVWQNKQARRQEYEGYATDVITDLSLKWLENRAPDRPFFLMCYYKAPHGLWEYPP